MPSFSRLVLAAVLLTAVGAIGASGAAAQTPTPLDPSDVIVDAAGSLATATASNAAGEFVVVWTESGLHAQRFSSDGVAIGGVLDVASPGAYPSVAVADSGTFLVVWRSNESGMWRVKKRFYSAGNVPTAAADVDADSDVLLWGDVAADNTGNFVVAWAEDVTGSYDFDIKVRRFDTGGSTTAAEQLVSSGTAADRNPRIDYSAGENGYVVVWDREVAGTYDVRARLLDAAGAPVAADFLVNTYTTLGQLRPDVARSREGGFTVVWEGAGSGDDLGIFGRSFDGAGAPLGDAFLLNDFTTGTQQRPRIDVDGSANFVVSWTSFGSPGPDSSESSVQARAWFADGTPLSEQFQINSYTTQKQASPEIAMLGGGEFVVTWDKNVLLTPDTFLDTRMRRFVADLPLFANGFESATTQAWSTTIF